MLERFELIILTEHPASILLTWEPSVRVSMRGRGTSFSASVSVCDPLDGYRFERWEGF
jgi:hypothetical protein